MIVPEEAGIGAVPEYEAKAAGEENRPTSRASPRIFAATSGPTPQIARRFAGAARSSEAVISRSSAAASPARERSLAMAEHASVERTLSVVLAREATRLAPL